MEAKLEKIILHTATATEYDEYIFLSVMLDMNSRNPYITACLDSEGL